MVKRIAMGDGGDVQDVTDKTPIANEVPGLDALAREAESAEHQGAAETQQAQDKQQKQEADTLAADLADTLAMVATVAGPGMWWLTPDEFERLWGKSVQKGIAASGAEIMRRHGLSMGGLMTQYGPYIALAGALGPSALATVHAYKREKAKQLGAANAATP